MRTHPKRNATHLALGAPTAALSSSTTAQHLSAFPISLPRLQRGEGHSRSCSTNITASQASWMLLHVVPGTTSLSAQPITAQAAPGETPAYRPPKGRHAARSRRPSSQAPGVILLVAACISVSGRMSAASIGPPGSWPCHPSTLRLSRLPQPPSRRIPKPPSIPSTRRAPRHFAVAPCGYRRRSRPQNAVP